MEEGDQLEELWVLHEQRPGHLCAVKLRIPMHRSA